MTRDKRFGFTQAEKYAVNHAWKLFQGFALRGGRGNDLRTCLRHERRGRDLWSAKALLMNQFMLGFHDQKIPNHALSVSFGCLWARAQGVLCSPQGKSIDKWYPREWGDFRAAHDKAESAEWAARDRRWNELTSASALTLYRTEIDA